MFLALGFIDNFSVIYGLPLPGRMRNHRDSNVVILPPYVSKSYVAQKYVENRMKFNQYFYEHRRFEELWHELHPYVITNMPATDLCLTC